MKLIVHATLKGKVNGETALWPKGSIFDDSVEPIPKDIFTELKAGTRLVEDITPVDETLLPVGGKVNVPPPAPKKKSKPVVKRKKAVPKKAVPKKNPVKETPPAKKIARKKL